MHFHEYQDANGNFFRLVVFSMFNCRMCTDDIASILGVGPARRNASAKYGSDIMRMHSTVDEGTKSPRLRRKFSIREPPRRSKIRLRMYHRLCRINSIRNWEGYVHPRAREFFTSHEALIDALRSIAKNINKDEDPILVGLVIFIRE